jgi:CRISPR-associated protein Csb1
MMATSLGALENAVAKDAAIRRVQRLQPAGGPGDKIFPPTFPGEGTNAPPRHVFESRRIDGKDVRCVLLDSVQSQANRLEEVLLGAMRDRRIVVPHLLVDFAGQKAELNGKEYDLSDLGAITSLDAPHRIFDAIIRDSELNGEAFLASELSERLTRSEEHTSELQSLS